MTPRIERFALSGAGYAVMAFAFLVANAIGYAYAGGMDFVQGWGGGLAAVVATVYLVFKSQGYWAWMIVNASLWIALFFHDGLPMLAWLQISFLFLSVYGAAQWFLVRLDIGFRPDRRSDVVGSAIAAVVFVYSLVAYLRMPGYAWTIWWGLELASVFCAIAAIWMDAFRYKGNWIAWTLSNCCSAPLFLHGSSWGPFYTLFAYQAINVVGYLRWRREEQATVALLVDGRPRPALVVGHA